MSRFSNHRDELAVYVCVSYGDDALAEYMRSVDTGHPACDVPFENCFEQLSCYLAHPYRATDEDAFAVMVVIAIFIVVLVACYAINSRGRVMI